MTNIDTIKSKIKEILDIPTYEKYINPLEFIGSKKKPCFSGRPGKKQNELDKKEHTSEN